MPRDPGPPRGLAAASPVVSSVAWHARVDSTSRIAAELAATGAPEVAVVVADEQTAGRGRRGRTWTAPPGTSLLCSLMARPTGPAAGRPLLSLLTALALVEAVDAVAPGLDAALKWPNDLLLGGAKAAGILLEGVGDAVVVGIGVDVDWRAVARPPDLAGTTSLAEALGGAVDRWAVMAALLARWGERYATWPATEELLRDYRARCATLDRHVRVEGVAEAVEGRAEAIDEDGHLVVRTRDRVLRTFAAGDVVHVRAERGDA